MSFPVRSSRPAGPAGSHPDNLPPYRFVAGSGAWADCLAALSRAPRLALDLEANSMFAYRERVCLIQVSTAAQDYIIDPQMVPDLDGLGEILADPAVEKVFHAAEYDLIMLDREYGWTLNNLFDTMWAARILGYNEIGLAALLERFYQVKLDKRYQRSDWYRRPLTPAQLAYAQKDTHYLLDLRDRLGRELEERDCLEEAGEIFREQARAKAVDNEFNPDGFWNMNGVIDMTPGQQAALKALYQFRNQEAARRDVPPFKIFGDRTLLDLAERLPEQPTDLRRIEGMSAGQQQRYGLRLLEIIAASQTGTPPTPPRRSPRPPDSVLIRYDHLHNWRKTRARLRGVESDVIVGREALWTIAQANPRSLEELAQLGVLGRWRLETYGHEILRTLRDSQNGRVKKNA